MPSQKLPGAGRGKGKRINGLKSSKHDLPAADPRDVTAHRWRKRFCSPVFDGHQRTEMVYKGWAETWVGARRGSERRGDPHCMAETPSAEAGPPVEIPFSNRVPHTSLHDLFATEAPAALLIAEDDGAVPAIKPVDARWRAGADLPAEDDQDRRCDQRTNYHGGEDQRFRFHPLSGAHQTPDVNNGCGKQSAKDRPA